jgi:predicted ATPase
LSVDLAKLLEYGAIAVASVIAVLLVQWLWRVQRQRGLVERARDARLKVSEAIRESAPIQTILGASAQTTYAVERIVIRDFKNIKHLDLVLVQPSSLAGNWTCIAGINGAGKSAILQALCLVLLGERHGRELGERRLKRMIRRESNGAVAEGARIEAWVRRDNEQPIRVAMYLNAEGVDEIALHRDPDYSVMRQVWDELRSIVLVSYGATRNLTQDEDTRNDSMAIQVRRQMTLFDPLTRMADVEVLIKGGNDLKRRTLQRLLEAILEKEEMGVSSSGDRLVFGRMGTKVDAIDLPDGFRSTVGWLADLCGAWHDSAPAEVTRTTDPSKITGIVLIDEIDLHLHPSFSRSIVPALRRALPLVQFIVSTHSPLVLSSFDRSELIVLEADEKGLVGTRELDRQVFAFSMDEIYKWLMRTPPRSSVIEEKIASGDDSNVLSYLYQSGGGIKSEGVNEADSQLLVEDLERLLKDVKKKAEHGPEGKQS